MDATDKVTVTLNPNDKIVNVQFAEHKEGDKTSYVYLKKDVTTTDVDDKFHRVLSPAVVCENGKCEINENIDELIKQVAEQEANAAETVAAETVAAEPVAAEPVAAETVAAAPVADQEANAEQLVASPVAVQPAIAATDTAVTTTGGRRTRNVRGGRKRRSTMKKRSRRSRSKRIV